MSRDELLAWALLILGWAVLLLFWGAYAPASNVG